MRHSERSCRRTLTDAHSNARTHVKVGLPNARNGLKRHSLCESSSLGLYEMPAPTSNPIGFAPAIIPQRSRERHGSQFS